MNVQQTHIYNTYSHGGNTKLSTHLPNEGSLRWPISDVIAAVAIPSNANGLSVSQ